MSLDVSGYYYILNVLHVFIEKYSNRLSKSSSVLFNFNKSFRLSANFDQTFSLFDIDESEIFFELSFIDLSFWKKRKEKEIKLI